ncbi:MAG: MBL fold metallo-hydrolase [bacterium]|nr:MBL fold metallo-hydrolase [bacterium]
MRKYLFYLFAFSLCVIVCLPQQTSGPEAIFFDVGQGDAFALRTPGKQIILVDGGPDNLLLPQLGQWLGYQEREIDYMILSHDHADHASALPEIAERYKVMRAILPVPTESSDSSALISALKRSDSEIIQVNESACFDLEINCRLCVLSPGGEFAEAKDLNESSLALHIRCAGLSIVAAGDATKDLEQSYLPKFSDWQADVFKASHHGANTSNDDSFLTAVNPEIMVISVGLNNSYGHPSPSVINRAKNQGVRIWRTDHQGSVKIYAKNRELFIESWP